MKRHTLILIIVLWARIGLAAPLTSVPYTKVKEADVEVLVKIGMDQKQVIDKVGTPNLVDTRTKGIETWQYLTDPQAGKDNKPHYGGFIVYFTEKQVTYVGKIIVVDN